MEYEISYWSDIHIKTIPAQGVAVGSHNRTSSAANAGAPSQAVQTGQIRAQISTRPASGFAQEPPYGTNLIPGPYQDFHDANACRCKHTDPDDDSRGRCDGSRVC